MKEKILDEIFGNDPSGLLTIKPENASARTSDERLRASFLEINAFFEKHDREPQPNPGDISEFQLYSRLKYLREDAEKIKILKSSDRHHLLPVIGTDRVDEIRATYEKPKEISSVDDILGDDSFNLLEDDSLGLFDFKHTPKDNERADADFIARRKPCRDFDQYEAVFKEIQQDLAEGKRKLIEFKEGALREGAFYVHNGVLMLLEKVNISQQEQSFSNGKRVRKDGRTKCVFENGTESGMLFRSLAKILHINGRAVTQNIDKIKPDPIDIFRHITDEDKEAGYIYVLKSKSTDMQIRSIPNLFKIGYSKTDVQERIKNAAKEPTYLMAPVRIQRAWKCYNMNPQKLELLLHNFFGDSCLELDVFDEKGKRHTPREWFIAPLEVIEQAVELIINGEIVNYQFDAGNMAIVFRS
ncbi:GIY-YIG nuclease family protein [Desulfococcaceae bacterium HSG9]|nr:GIY-YIG nuclease family protein [Desulfococcaceae bacterium HSG9]